MKKYEFTGETKTFVNCTLHRIRAVRNFGTVKAGDLGGWIEKEENLSHIGRAWVSENALVCGDSLVFDNAQVADSAEVCGNAQIYGDACVRENASVYLRARVYGKAIVSGNARVYGDSWVYNNAHVCGNAWVRENAHIYGQALVSDKALISGRASINSNASVSSETDYATITGFGKDAAPMTFFRCSDGKIRAQTVFLDGTMEDFRAYAAESIMSKEYLMIADLIDMHF